MVWDVVRVLQAGAAIERRTVATVVLSMLMVRLLRRGIREMDGRGSGSSLLSTKEHWGGSNDVDLRKAAMKPTRTANHPLRTCVGERIPN